MKLQNFENNVPHSILTRGEDYYENDLIENVEHEYPDKWSAEIEGSDYYHVEVELNGDDIVSWDCDCPYDYGDICKHVVAFLLYIRENRKDHPVTIENLPTPEQQEISDLLQYTGKKEIVDFLSKYAKEHQGFYQELESQFHPKKKNKLPKEHTKEIQKCFKARNSSYDRYGHSSEADDIADNLNVFIEKSRYLVNHDCPEEAASMLLQIIKNIGEEYEEFQDYDGSLGGVCQEASEILTGIIENNASGELLASMMDEIGVMIKNENYENYDLADLNGLLFLISLKTTDVESAIKIIDETLQVEPDSFRSGSLVISKIDLLKNAGRQEEVESVISQYLYLPEIRKIRLEKLIENKAYQEALPLIDEGIKLAEKENHPGTACDWKDQKLSIYQKTGQKENVIQLAENLFITGRDSMKYFHILKNTVPSDQWTSYLDNFLVLAEKSKQYIHAHVLAQIYIEEKYWDKLMDFYEKHMHLNKNYNSAESYEEHLKPLYPERILELYHSKIFDYAEMNMGRDHYQYIGRILKRMKTYPGGTKVVAEIVSQFRKIYSNRRAMMEELGGL
ncbi:MAG: SWIM zinc finger family protein [Tannerella sp.]|jgi:tetratricopeptide (TPR) repeat protein|nr:SWIM zinc finger family protein [Tannerella sp.]